MSRRRAFLRHDVHDLLSLHARRHSDRAAAQQHTLSAVRPRPHKRRQLPSSRHNVDPVKRLAHQTTAVVGEHIQSIKRIGAARRDGRRNNRVLAPCVAEFVDRNAPEHAAVRVDEGQVPVTDLQSVHTYGYRRIVSWGKEVGRDDGRVDGGQGRVDAPDGPEARIGE